MIEGAPFFLRMALLQKGVHGKTKEGSATEESGCDIAEGAAVSSERREEASKGNGLSSA